MIKAPLWGTEKATAFAVAFLLLYPARGGNPAYNAAKHLIARILPAGAMTVNFAV